jgi:hypothetical protein
MFHESMHLREQQQGVGRAHATSPAAAIGGDGAAAIGDEQPPEVVADAVLPAGIIISGMQAGIRDTLHCATFHALPHAALCHALSSAASIPCDYVLFASRCTPVKLQVRWSSVCEAA